MLFQHRQLIQRGAIENHIRIFLVGENPAFFTALYRIPHGDGALDGGAPGFIVPHNPPQQTQITGGNPIVVIQVQRKQRTDIEFEHLMLRHAIGHHLGVEAVDSLHNDNGIILQPQLLPVPLPFPGHKIKGWEHDLLPGKQRGNIRPEQGSVQGVDMLQIQLAIRAGGKFIPVDVIVI